MAESIEIAVPWAWPNATVNGTMRGTMPSDMQLVLASMFEYHPTKNGGTTRAGIYRTNGVELHTDATIGVHEGSVILDTGSNRVVWAPIPHIANVPHDLPVGTKGSITVYVAPPTGSSPNATVGTTTSATVKASWVVIDRIDLPSGWTRTNQGVRNWDKEFAVLQGTGSGVLSEAKDSDSAQRTSGPVYRRMQQKFSTPTDSDISIGLTSTIRAENVDGTAMDYGPLNGGSVIYDIFVDGNPVYSVERMVTGVTTTEYWEVPLTVSAGEHSVYAESRVGVIGEGRTKLPWRVVSGGWRKHMGDILRVKHEGVSK